MYDSIKNFANDESGATAIEYGLIAALVSVAAQTDVCVRDKRLVA